MGLQEASIAFYKTILANIHDPIFVKDDRHQWVFVNDAFCTLVGYPREALIGQSDDTCFAKRQLKTARESDDLVLAGGQAMTCDMVITNAQGIEHAVQVEKVPAQLPDGRNVIIGTLHDISELQALRAEKASGAWDVQRKSEFMTNVTHELRTPLNGMLGLTILMAEGNLESEQRELLSQIRSSATLLLSITNDMLDEAALANGKLKIYQSEFDLRQLLQKTLNLVQNGMVEHENCFVLTVENTVPEHVVMDPKRLQQILINLLSNADKFTQEGKISLSVRTIDAHTGSPRIVFEVTDTGCGISLREQESIFERFTQIDSRSTRQTIGSGLGLSIVNQLCLLMHGQIELESELGQGSTFRIYLPLKTTQGQGSPSLDTNDPTLTVPDESGNPYAVPCDNGPAGTAIAQNQSTPTLSILVAEDNPVNLMVIEKMLKKQGYEATIVSDGMAAVDAAMAYHYDLIFMDINMPKLDGIEATRRIISDQPNAFICALTSNFGAEESKRFFRVGMKAHLTKPYTISELLTVLNLCTETLPRQ